MILSIHMYVYIYGYMRVIIYACMHVCVNIHLRACVYVRVAIYLHTLIFVYAEAPRLSPARGSGAGGWRLVADGSWPVAGGLRSVVWGLGPGARGQVDGGWWFPGQLRK